MNLSRRLPIYLLIDVSESMAGPAMLAVEQGVKALVDSLKGDPMALETAYLSVITFSRKAEQVVPLTELMHFTPPKFSVRSGSSLGAALRLLMLSIKRDVVKTTATTKGDWRPLVFVLTDGQPTDDWERAAEEMRRANSPRVANLYAIGCGPDVDPAVLRRVADVSLMMTDLTPEGFRKFFLWLSASVQSASVKPDAEPGGLDRLPPGVQLADDDTEYDPTPRQVFLQARCQKTRKPYLMRFARRDRDGLYEAIAGHPLEHLETGSDAALPPVSSDDLDGCPSCPFCENPVAGTCPCGTLFCTTTNARDPITCPTCRAELVSGPGGPVKVRRSMG